MTIASEKISIESQYGVGLDNWLITNSDGNETLVALFGGAGYTLDAPLFHYIRKGSVNAGCDVLRVEYGYRIPGTLYNTMDKDKIIADSLAIVKQCLEKRSYKKVIFVSKSLGTAIAGEVARLMGSNAVISHVYLTPIKSTLPHLMMSEGLVVIGTDSLFPPDCIQDIRANTNLSIHLIENGDHGLEVKDAPESIQILAKVVGLTVDYIKASLT